MTWPVLHFPPTSLLRELSVLLLCGGFFLMARRSRLRGAAGRRDFAVLFLLRAGALAGILLMLLTPDLLFQKHRTDAPVAFVFDDSQSMGALDSREGKETRWEAALNAFSRRRAFLETACSPVLFRSSREPNRFDGAEGSPDGTLSNLSALADLPREVPGLAAVYLFSDGRHGGGPSPRQALGGLGIPLHTIGAGDPAALGDSGLDLLRTAPFGYKNVPAEAAVRLRFRALPPGRHRLSVVQNGITLGSRWVDHRDEEVVESTVTFRPRRVGVQTFEASLSPSESETNVRNNRASFSMDIGRDRRRILYICGQPGPNHAFLRQQLKSDPTVDLVTFIILRDREDLLAYSDEELSLIPFPTRAELIEGLPDFDAVIFENFSFHLFGLGSEGMDRLADYVKKGGGFLLLGEGSSFVPSSPYKGSSMEPLLPFRLDRPPRSGRARFPAALPDRAPFPLFDPSSDPSRRRIPLLEGDGFFPSGLTPRAAAVLEADLPGDRVPIAALNKAGKGRVMALASLTTWRWALGGGEDGGGAAAYVRFWSETLSWLSGDEAFKQVRLLPPPSAAVPGDDILLRAVLRDEAGRPLLNGEAGYTLVVGGKTLRSGSLSPAGEGEYLAAVTVDSPGLVRATVWGRNGGASLGTDSRVISVGADWNETNDVSPDFSLLEDLSSATGGRFVPLSGFGEEFLAETLAPLSRETSGRWTLGRSPLWGGIVLFFLLGEWIFRRRRGFP